MRLAEVTINVHIHGILNEQRSGHVEWGDFEYDGNSEFNII